MSLNSRIAVGVSVTRLVMSQRAKAPRAIFACTTTNRGCFVAGSMVRNFGDTTRSASRCVRTVLLYSPAARLMMRPDRGQLVGDRGSPERVQVRVLAGREPVAHLEPVRADAVKGSQDPVQ